MKHTDSNKIERIVRILSHLLSFRDRRFPTAQLHNFLQQFGPVNLRAVQRDLQVLVSMNGGIVHEYIDGRKKYYSIEPSYASIKESKDTLDPLPLFLLLKRITSSFSNKSEAIEMLEERLSKSITSSEYGCFIDFDSRLDSSFRVIGTSQITPLDDHILADCLKALVSQHRLEIDYRRDDVEKTRKLTVCPVRIILYKGELYLLCISEKNAARDYYIKIRRIISTSLSGRFPVTRARLVRIDNRLSKSFGIFDDDTPRPQKIILRFVPHLNRILSEQKFHSTQTIHKQKDGTVFLKMTVPAGFDLVRWVLSWGDEVTVIKPEHLRREIVRVGREIVRRNRI